jgi:hypothetical protein
MAVAVAVDTNIRLKLRERGAMAAAGVEPYPEVLPAELF